MVLGALNSRQWEWIWNEVQKASPYGLCLQWTQECKREMESRLEPDVEWKIEWDGNGME